jgi:hypothetical protein
MAGLVPAIHAVMPDTTSAMTARLLQEDQRSPQRRLGCKQSGRSER